MSFNFRCDQPFTGNGTLKIALVTDEEQLGHGLAPFARRSNGSIQSTWQTITIPLSEFKRRDEVAWRDNTTQIVDVYFSFEPDDKTPMTGTCYIDNIYLR